MRCSLGLVTTIVFLVAAPLHAEQAPLPTVTPPPGLKATVLVTDNPGCLLHLRGAADARGMKLRLAHVAKILAERLV